MLVRSKTNKSYNIKCIISLKRFPLLQGMLGKNTYKVMITKEDSNRFVDSPTFTAGNDLLERGNTNHTVKIHNLFF